MSTIICLSLFPIINHQKHRLVEKVDYISSPGYLTGGDARKKAGLPGRGPSVVITDRGILAPYGPEKELLKQEREWLKTNNLFIPPWKHGSTWVNQQCWRDGYHPDFEKHLKYEKERPLREKKEREVYKQKLRDEWQPYLEGKSTKALIDLKKDKGHAAGLCGWLIDEILTKREMN